MSVEVGKVVDGKVSGIREFGAFVQLPDGNTGLVHISEVSDGYIKDVKSCLSENQIVKVKILSVGDNGKISLSIRKAVDKPNVGTIAQRPERRTEQRKTSSNSENAPHDFERMLADFMKGSDARMHDIKRNVESKRGSARR